MAIPPYFFAYFLMRHNTTEAKMKRDAAQIITWTTAIIFSLTAVLCPLEAARSKKGEAKARQAAQSETKQEKGDGGKKEALEQAPENDKTVKGDEKGETEGIPTKEYKDEDFKPPVEEESFLWMFVKMILVLGVLGAGFYYFYRFVSKKSGVSLFGGDAIRVLSVVPLGQNKFLNVVDLAGKVVVVGVSDNNINLITEITEKDQIDRIRILSTRTPPSAAGGGGFQDNILRQIGRILTKVQGLKHRDGRFKSSGIDHPSDVEYLRQQKTRLKNLNGVDDE
jgi:flagellar protein FliO/FliZ